MNCRVLITGSAGLIGDSLRRALLARGVSVAGLDLRGEGGEFGDVRNLDRVREALAGCDGVVQLAAVSRVIWGEQDPDACWRTNIGGLGNVIAAAEEQARPPWLIFASSREVYGQVDNLPATEDAPISPVNVYGRSKANGEIMVRAAATRGLRAAIVRLSNVYGSAEDHPDRVVPAFARAAAAGAELQVHGVDRTFDFTHLDDVVRGIEALVDVLQTGQFAPPPIHFASGQSTSLGQLASLAVELAGGKGTIVQADPRARDVARFCGNPARARQMLAWTPRIPLRDGLARLIADFRKKLDTAVLPSTLSAASGAGIS
jgi:UDP-glucose 4-epimerase